MANKIFTLLRHGKVNGEPALYGHTDIALSAQGRGDLENALNKIHTQCPIDHITTSPLIRCATIAQEFAAKYKIPLQLDPRLKEMHFGSWDGIPFDAMGEIWQQLEEFWCEPFLIHPPEGETLAAFAQRVICAWETLIQTNSGHHHLVICHGGVIKIILAHILQIDWRNASLFKQLHIDYASSTRIEISDCEGALPLVKWIGAKGAN